MKDMKDKISKAEDCLAHGKIIPALEYGNQLREKLREKHPELYAESSWVEEELNGYDLSELPEYRKNVRGELRWFGHKAHGDDIKSAYFIPYDDVAYSHQARNMCKKFYCPIIQSYPELLKIKESDIPEKKSISINDLPEEYYKRIRKDFDKDVSISKLHFFLASESIEEIEKAITQRLQEFLNEMREILPEEDFKPTNYYNVNNHGDYSQTTIGNHTNPLQVNGSNNPVVSQKNTEGPINTSGSRLSKLFKMLNWIKSFFLS